MTKFNRDQERDNSIIDDYLLKLRGKYVLKLKEIALIYKISEIRIYQILERNGIKKRREIKI